MNQVFLTAIVQELSALRYTPAGIPALDIRLEHSSEVLEAGARRRIDMTLSAVALGDIAHLLVDTPLGAQLQIEGFLAPSRKGSSKLVLHIQQASRTYPGAAIATV